MTASLDNLQDLTMNRARLYLFLSRIYREEIDREYLERMKRKSKPINLTDLEISKIYAELHNFLKKIKINDQLIEELAADYCSLFLGVGRHPAFPYESVYLSEDRIVMRDQRSDVLKTYHQEGLQKADSSEPEDHIATELEFMAHLCLKMHTPINENNKEQALKLLDKQKKFLKRHLKAWAPQFCDDIINGSITYDFYKIIGTLTKQYILIEENTIIQSIKELKEYRH